MAIITEQQEQLKLPPVLERYVAYNVDDQLNCLYDDIEAGLFGEAAKTGKFAEYVRQVKADNPK